MPRSDLRLIKRSAEFIPRSEVSKVPRERRGIYVLYLQRGVESSKFDVLYVGMARAGRGRGLMRRLRAHAKSARKRKWTHFSVFEVWDNVSDDEVVELEGLFRHIYRYDTRASPLNRARGFKRLSGVRNDKIAEWM